VPEKCTAFSKPLKKKGFVEKKVTTMGLDDLDTSTTLESNKSQATWTALNANGSGWTILL